MLLDIAFLGLMFFLSIPTVLAYFAHCYKKKFWFWFTVGLILPVVSYLILLIVLYYDERRIKKEYNMTLEEETMMSRLIEEQVKKKHPSKPSGS